MCGIAGLIGVPRNAALAAAPRMLAAMRHRGPDDEGTQVVTSPAGDDGPAVVLLHRRLAVLDLSPAGHQPMADAPPTDALGPPNWVVFNGEVFNFQALHADLARAGWPCRTRCDTEVILHAYRAWGESCVGRMRGMFAWCLLDAGRQTAWLCRDRLGVKPLYLVDAPTGGLLFASELRTLLAAGPELVPRRVDPVALESFLAQGAVCGLASIVAGVRLLAPGQSLVTDWSGRRLSSRAYWQMPFRPTVDAEGGDANARDRAIAPLAQSLRDAVRLRLIADVPLGLFLSGGVDSGALAALATEVAGAADVQTVSIGFDQPEYDETDAAAAVALELRTDHRTVQLTGADVLHDLPDVLAAMDQPTVDGFNTYFASGAARGAGLTVALSGLGGDELFAGYASFRDVPRALAARGRAEWLGGPGRRLLRQALDARGGRASTKAAAMLGRARGALPMYLLRRELFLPAERRELHALPPGSDEVCGVPRAVMDDLQTRADGLDVTNQVSLFELSSYMRDMLLRDADVFSMAHGLEVRVPLLDHVVVEQVTAMPGAWKTAGRHPKAMLVDAVGPRLPSRVYRSPKRGFTFPWDAWLRGPLRDRAARAVGNADAWSALGLDPAAPTRLWDRFCGNDRRVAALQILGLLVLEDFTTRHDLRGDSRE